MMILTTVVWLLETSYPAECHTFMPSINLIKVFFRHFLGIEQEIKNTFGLEPRCLWLVENKVGKFLLL